MIIDPLTFGASSPCPPPIGMSNAEARAFAFLLPLSEDYPGIARWFTQKVVPGVRAGTRLMLPVERDGTMVGLGIAKKEADERKICTVRVAPSHTGRGIGVRLFDGLLKWLDDDRPHLTVSAAKLPQFERIFDYYKFDVTSAKEGLYVPQITELGYNEPVVFPSTTPLNMFGTNPAHRESHQA